MGLLERMPILDKTINTPALANGDAQAGMDDEEQLPYPNNIGTRTTPTTSPTSQVLLVNALMALFQFHCSVLEVCALHSIMCRHCSDTGFGDSI